MSHDQDDEVTLAKLSLLEELDDEDVVAKLTRIIKAATREVVENLDSLRGEVRTLKAALQDRDATIKDLKSEVRDLREANDALEQYGRRHSLRISGIDESKEDTTAAVVELANDVLELDPPLDPKDIDVSHRLAKPRNAKPEEPRPVIVRFMTRTDRYRILADRRKLKNFNENRPIKIYINEDLTRARARLFSTVRRIQKKGHFEQCWTTNGNIKVKDLNGRVQAIKNVDDIKACLPNVDLSKFV